MRVYDVASWNERRDSRRRTFNQNFRCKKKWSRGRPWSPVIFVSPRRPLATRIQKQKNVLIITCLFANDGVGNVVHCRNLNGSLLFCVMKQFQTMEFECNFYYFWGKKFPRDVGLVSETVARSAATRVHRARYLVGFFHRCSVMMMYCPQWCGDVVRVVVFFFLHFNILFAKLCCDISLLFYIQTFTSARLRDERSFLRRITFSSDSWSFFL